MVALRPADLGCHMVARLLISRRMGAAEDLVRAPVRRISFIEAKRRAAVIQRIMRTAAGGNLVAFPVMRRCQAAPPKGPPCRDAV
jgi:hypothetical protein